MTEEQRYWKGRFEFDRKKNEYMTGQQVPTAYSIGALIFVVLVCWAIIHFNIQ